MKLAIGTPWYRHEGPSLNLELARKGLRFRVEAMAEVPGVLHVRTIVTDMGLLATVQQDYGKPPSVTMAAARPRLPHFGVGINATGGHGPEGGWLYPGKHTIRFGRGR
jgi:hypothetical protein